MNSWILQGSLYTQDYVFTTTPVYNCPRFAYSKNYQSFFNNAKYEHKFIQCVEAINENGEMMKTFETKTGLQHINEEMSKTKYCRLKFPKPQEQFEKPPWKINTEEN